MPPPLAPVAPIVACLQPSACMLAQAPDYSLPCLPLLPTLQLRGQANPFIAAYEGSRSRLQRGVSRLGSGALTGRPSMSAEMGGGSANGVGTGLSPFQSSSALGGAARGGAGASEGARRSMTSSSTEAEPPAPTSALLAAMAALDLPQPTPAEPAEVAVACMHYAPAARMLAVVLQDGRCALCRTADSGIHPVEQLQLFRWVYKPASPAAPAAVAVALNPTAQLLALGLSHGRVAIYTMQSLLSARHHHHHHLRSSSTSSVGGGVRSSSSAEAAAAAAGPGGGSGSGSGSGPGQPEPARVLSLADWGYRSSVVGSAAVLQWSPDGRVLAVGYAERGMAVWTPSGCRLMCSLRQAVATAAPGTSGLGLAGVAAQMAASTPGEHQQSQAEQQQQQQQQQRGADGMGATLGSPGKRAPGGALGNLWSQMSTLNPSQAPEAGVLEVRRWRYPQISMAGGQANRQGACICVAWQPPAWKCPRSCIAGLQQACLLDGWLNLDQVPWFRSGCT